MRRLASLAVLVIVVGCGDPDATPGQPCIPSSLFECACDDGAIGSKTCRLDGLGWDPCRCMGSPAPDGGQSDQAPSMDAGTDREDLPDSAPPDTGADRQPDIDPIDLAPDSAPDSGVDASQSVDAAPDSPLPTMSLVDEFDDVDFTVWERSVSGAVGAFPSPEGDPSALINVSSAIGRSASIRSIPNGWSLTSRPRFSVTIRTDSVTFYQLAIGLEHTGNSGPATLGFLYDGIDVQLRVLGSGGVETFLLDTRSSMNIVLNAEVIDATSVGWEVKFPTAPEFDSRGTIRLASPIDDDSPANFVAQLSTSDGQTRQVWLQRVEIHERPQ
jgi:hypothetical protein